MTGLDAISAHNGWYVAGLGVSIVFTGLVILAITISQLYKILAIWENRRAYFEWFRQKHTHVHEIKPQIILPQDIQDSARLYKMLIEHMGEHPFSLPQLLDYAVRRGLEHPYATLNDLLMAKVIIPTGDGFYIWNEHMTKIAINIKKQA